MNISYTIEELEKAFRRHFRHEHGHDPINACRTCDPDEVNLLEEAWRKRFAEKAAAAKAAEGKPKAD